MVEILTEINLCWNHDTINPYTKRQFNIVFKEEPFPKLGKEISIPPGNIYVYRNGSRYLVLGGKEDGRSLLMYLRNHDNTIK